MMLDNLLRSDFPKVSIIIPVYNGVNFLAEAIRSAINQTYKNLEIIVINDGSNDDGGTERIAQSFGSAIRYFVKPNGGVASSLNLGIREMRGDYFSWLSHDDLYSQDKIEQQVKALRASPEGKFIFYSDYSIFTDNPKTAVPVRLKKILPKQFRCWLTIKSTLHGCTLLIPRTAFEELGGFNEKLLTTQDYDLWFRLSEKYYFIHIKNILVMARSHSKQGTYFFPDLVITECNNLFSGFIEKLTAEEIVSMMGSNFGTAYLKIASTMWKRGYEKPAILASNLAYQHGVSRLRIKLIRSMALSRLLVVKLFRKMLSLRIRQIICVIDLAIFYKK